MRKVIGADKIMWKDSWKLVVTYDLNMECLFYENFSYLAFKLS